MSLANLLSKNHKNAIFSKGQHLYISKLIILVGIRPVIVVSVENWLGEFCFFNLQLQTGVIGKLHLHRISSKKVRRKRNKRLPSLVYNLFKSLQNVELSLESNQ